MIKNIVFDLDGVLFDGCELHANIFLQAVSHVRPDIHIHTSYHDTVLHALSTRKKLEILGITGNDAEDIYTKKQDMTAMYISNNVHQDSKNIHICKTLLSLQYRLFCVSNSIRSTIETVLAKQGILDMFSGIISNQDTTEPKPSPEPYLTLYRTFQLSPKECLILEDSEHGIESAKKSGGNVLCVKNCNDVTLDTILHTTHTLSCS